MDRPRLKRDRLIDTLAGALGRISLLLFLIFLFRGPFTLVRPNLSEPALMMWNLLLSVLFFLQHSLMIRRRVRYLLTRVLPEYLSGAVYTICSALLLIVLVFFWQTSSEVIYDLKGMLFWNARGVFVLGLAGFTWAVIALKGFDPFGQRPIRLHLRGKQLRPPQFSVRGPYLLVRHPFYLATLLLIWSCPLLTADRLLFNVLWSSWIYVGAILEERDLVRLFGRPYRQYQQQVPMLFPWPRIRS